MSKLTRIVGLLLLVSAGTCVAAELPMVTLEVSKCPATEVLAQIQAQVPGVQIAAMPGVTDEITVTIVARPLQEALKTVAAALKGSVVRGYLIERKGPGDTPYSGSDLLDFVMTARADWRSRLTPKQRQALEDRSQEKLGQIGQTGEGLPRVDVLSYHDPLLRYALLPTNEKISLTADGQPLQAVVDDFMLQSGYAVLLEENVDGTVTALEESNQELAPILDKLAAAGQAKWRTFYLVSQPVKLTAEEAQKRADQVFSEMWQGFWNQPPAQRAKMMERLERNLSAIPPERLSTMKASPSAGEMFIRVMRATAQLTMEQRREFAPVIRALGKVMSQQ
ncbi:MAG: hypothetical protein ACYC63_03390 [Armatimonadota bacterium]